MLQDCHAILQGVGGEEFMSGVHCACVSECCHRNMSLCVYYSDEVSRTFFYFRGEILPLILWKCGLKYLCVYMQSNLSGREIGLV